jgi:hypothetical protein
MEYDSAIAQATINTCINIIPVISDACGGQFLYQADVQLCTLFINVRPTVYISFNVALVYVDAFVPIPTSESDSCEL